MKGLIVHTSNRLEILIEQLAGILSAVPSGRMPVAVRPDIVVVQSKGMERWISLELARINGISANCRFPFPNTFLHELCDNAGLDVTDTAFFRTPTLGFAIMKALPELIDRPGFEMVRRYLADDPNQLKLYQFSQKTADIIDQYTVFRPDFIASWEKNRGGSDPHHQWQGMLWRWLTEKNRGRDRASLRAQLLASIRNNNGTDYRLPGHISVFGLSHLPMFHLEVFQALSALVPVHLYVLNPCREYWADIVNPAEEKKISAAYTSSENRDSDLYLESGNRLLASFGALGRDFQHLVAELDGHVIEKFDAPGAGTLLSSIQADICTLTDREYAADSATGIENCGRQTSGPDGSVQIHSCHSPMREVEVLYDQLLNMFENDPSLEPGEVMVLAPSIEIYTPFIQAVFGTDTENSPALPFSIADRSPVNKSPVANQYLRLLGIKESRLGASEILGLLESEGIRNRFEFTDADVDKITRWIRETNIRWGVDKAHRKKLGLPGFSENTWASGLERMMLGYALPGDNRRMFAGILPYDNIEGKEGLVLGKLMSFMTSVTDLKKKLETPATLNAWCDRLNQALDAFFGGDLSIENDCQFIRAVVSILSEVEEKTDLHLEMDFQVIHHFLSHQLTIGDTGSVFFSGRINFCSMLPMRSIPARIICALGMNHDAFPRESHAPSFDLITAYPRRGDRSRRNDDKYLFLEMLISARDKLYISFIGQNHQDNTKIPPSGPVSELMDYIVQGYAINADRMITYHRLQAFSPDYFKETSSLFSYSAENCMAGRKLTMPKDRPVFFHKPLPEPSVENKILDLHALASFFGNPTRFLCENRLGLYLPNGEAAIEDKERFNLDGLEKYMLGGELVDAGSPDNRFDKILTLQRARGTLPMGTMGEVVYADLSVDAGLFHEKISKMVGEGTPESTMVDILINEFQIYGRIQNVYPSALINVRYGNTRGIDLVRTFIQHLCLTGGSATTVSCSYLLCKDAVWRFENHPPVENILIAYLKLYWEGLHHPLHFFPVAGYAYTRALRTNGMTREDSMKKALQAWAGSDWQRGESDDLYYQKCFADEVPLDEVFESNALCVFEPIFDCCSEVRL
ncbi:MAG: exodeoxyribonuclease V subunit gamma [Desulfobacteraceae bacterium]|nr:exodeoxyribonuclease V subunit gamma [Desulfobacteraceae bacterium]